MNTSWKKVFLENYLRRDLWKNANANSFASPAQKQFQLSVSARFKPKGFDVNADSVKKVSLPLHQRLQLIRMNRNITSQKEAFHVLVNQGGWFGGNVDDLDDVDEMQILSTSSLLDFANSKASPPRKLRFFPVFGSCARV